MSPLRLIILIVGLIFILVVYFWESIKQKRLQRKQTVRRTAPQYELSDIKIAQQEHDQSDYAADLPELIQTLSDTSDIADLAGTGPVTVAEEEPESAESVPVPKLRQELETRDMFEELEAESEAAPDQPGAADQEIDVNRIISLHITALPAQAFSGREIQAAINEVGLKYGDMKIFHHYGVGEMHSEQPLFSLTDMFEPGYFDLSKLDQHTTRGLTLFFCLPSRIDAQVVFELMLNTAQRLAHRLGGEIRGQDQSLIKDKQIADIRNKINQQTYENQT